jgi:homoserine kinase
MEKKSASAFAPATVANVGLGFDFMGFAVEGQGDTVSISFANDANSQITLTGKYGGLIPTEIERNTAGVAALAFLKVLGKENTGLNITLEKNLPLGSGMGSSASSAAAALTALNELFGNPFTVQQLIPFAMEGERAACGTAHADNAAPSLLGGFVIIRSRDPLDIIELKCPDDLFCSVIHPHVELKTADARRVLKREIALSDVTKQCANVAAFTIGLLREDYELLGRSMHDILAEPKRLQLIPGYEPVHAAALRNGAVGCGISGSGPSIFALCKGKSSSEAVSAAMKEALEKAGLGSDSFITTLNARGAYVI